MLKGKPKTLCSVGCELARLVLRCTSMCIPSAQRRMAETVYQGRKHQHLASAPPQCSFDFEEPPSAQFTQLRRRVAALEASLSRLPTVGTA